MNIKIDTVADALYVTLEKGAVVKTESRGDYLVDYGGNGALLGFEILNFSKKIPNGACELAANIHDRKAIA